MWSRYWFAEGGRLSAAVVRVAIATSLLWTLIPLHADYAEVVAEKSAELYDPVGTLLLLGDAMPPAWLLDALLAAAWTSTAFMLVGLFTRLSTAVSLASALTLASFEVSFSPGWSHHNNLVFLAQIAFLFAWGGDALSLDALVRRLRGRPAPAAHRYQFSIRLVQFAVALVFFNAAMIKLAQGGFTLSWALSDNLRHHILARFDWVGVPRTAMADWLVESELRYKAAALLNLVSQSLPLCACFLVRRPLLRAACGAFFAIETVALGVVMDLWNLHWLPLTAVFIDWDRLVAWARERLGRPADAPPAGPMPARQRRRLGVFVAVFFAYDLVVSFAYPRIDTRLGTFPFSSFPMFSRVRAKEPYGEHQSYEFIGGRIEVTSTPPAEPEMLSWLNRRRAYRFLHRTRARDKLRSRLAGAERRLEERFSIEVEDVRFYLTVFQAPAYPAPARLEPIPIAIIAEWSGEERSLATLLGRVGRDEERGARFLELEPIGLAPPGPEARFVYFADGRPEPHPLPVERRGDRFYFGEVEGETQAFAVEVERDGETERFFIARHPHDSWW